LAEDSVSVYDLDMSDSVALLFGNEHLGVSEEAQKYSDGNFIIPMVGMVQSLNISVACAVTLYEAYRQRDVKGYYSDNQQISPKDKAELFEIYENRQRHKLKNKLSKRLND
jgi:tRNA (guanosine-2'-O-)-methyltransferase